MNHSTQAPLARISQAMRCCSVLLPLLPCLLTAGEALVPAQFNQKTDSLGNRWDINQAGQINDGRNDCFDTAMVLTVNGQQFNPNGPNGMQQTADGSEWVLSGTCGQVQMTRRIRVDTSLSVVRYVEIFTNPANQKVQVQMALQTNLGGTCNAVMTDQGRNEPTDLQAKESSICMFQNPGHRPSVVWTLAGTKSGPRPTIVQQNMHYSFLINWSFELKPNSTVAIVHSLFQRDFPQPPPPADLQKLVAPVISSKWIANLPADLRGKILNMGLPSASIGEFRAPTLAMLYEELGATPGSADLLLVGESTRLVGQVVCQELRLVTTYGEKAIPLDQVAIVLGGSRKNHRALVALRDGQVVRGAPQTQGLRFSLRSGLVMDLAADDIDRLVFRESPPTAPEGADLFLETPHGDRLAVRAGTDVQLPCSTSWGPMSVPLGEVLWIRRNAGSLGHVMTLKNGSSFRIFLCEGSIVLDTALFGRKEFAFTDITTLYSVAARDSDQEALAEAVAREPHAQLFGGTTFLGRIDASELHLIAEGQAVPVAAGMIKTLVNITEESAKDGRATGTVFRADLWDGSQVIGAIQESLLTLRGGSRVIRVTPRDLISLRGSEPVVPDSLRGRIAELIKDLGHPEWQRREAASRGLAEIGALAKGQLNEIKAKTQDGEVRRRVEILLSDLEKTP